MARNIVQHAESALNDLIGLIPKGLRRSAESDIDTIQQALRTLQDALDFAAEASSKADRVANLAALAAERAAA